MHFRIHLTPQNLLGSRHRESSDLGPQGFAGTRNFLFDFRLGGYDQASAFFRRRNLRLFDDLGGALLRLRKYFLRLLRFSKLTVADEIENALSYYEATFLREIPRVYAELEKALSSGGHIAGIVNPPGPKGWYLTGDELPPNADAWRKTAEKHAGSWWEDWAKWSAANAGELIDPPPLGSDSFPVLAPGPGGYVLT